jgi:lauroyl/myristoyl acyltransferase
LQALGAALGWLTYWLSPTYRRRMAANAQQAGLSAPQWKPAIAAAGRMVMELPFLWRRPPGQPILPRMRFENDGLVEAALARGKGVLLLTPHMGCFEVAAQALAEGAASSLGQAYPEITTLWQRHWERMAPALAYPVPVRRLLYSTNAIESLHRTLRKSLKVRGHFPSAEAASKLLYLALRNAEARLGTPQHWGEALRHIRVLFGDRVPAWQ